jgi:hypothetical protein
MPPIPFVPEIINDLEKTRMDYMGEYYLLRDKLCTLFKENRYDYDDECDKTIARINRRMKKLKNRISLLDKENYRRIRLDVT